MRRASALACRAVGECGGIGWIQRQVGGFRRIGVEVVQLFDRPAEIARHDLLRPMVATRWTPPAREITARVGAPHPAVDMRGVGPTGFQVRDILSLAHPYRAHQINVHGRVARMGRKQPVAVRARHPAQDGEEEAAVQVHGRRPLPTPPAASNAIPSHDRRETFGVTASALP